MLGDLLCCFAYAGVLQLVFPFTQSAINTSFAYSQFFRRSTPIRLLIWNFLFQIYPSVYMKVQIHILVSFLALLLLFFLVMFVLLFFMVEVREYMVLIECVIGLVAFYINGGM